MYRDESGTLAGKIQTLILRVVHLCVVNRLKRGLNVGEIRCSFCNAYGKNPQKS